MKIVGVWMQKKLVREVARIRSEKLFEVNYKEVYMRALRRKVVESYGCDVEQLWDSGECWRSVRLCASRM